jgi:hypothetical protein
MNKHEVIVKAIWDWLHGEHETDNGVDKYRTQNACLWGVIDEHCVGIDSQIDLHALAYAIEEKLNFHADSD